MNNQISQIPISSHRQRGENRERLIAAGYKILAERGYEATTVKEIALHARVSPGLFHYYFTSKDELLLAVVKEAGERFKHTVVDTLHEMVGANGPDFLRAMTSVHKKRAQTDITWYRLRYELYALGLRNPTFLPAIGELLDYVRTQIAASMREHFGYPEAEAQAIAGIIMACNDGLPLQQLVQPTIDTSASFDILCQFIIDHSRLSR